MQISLSFDPTNSDEVAHAHSFTALLLVRKAKVTITGVESAPAAQPGGEASSTPGDAAPAKPRGRPKKEEKAEETFDLGFDAPAEGEAPSVEAPALKLDDVIKALQVYSQAKGVDKAREIVAKFKVKAVKDLKPEQFADVIALARV